MNGTLIQESSNQLLINSDETTIYAELKASLEDCISFNFNVAFITFGGLQLFVRFFDELRAKGIRGKIITSTYLDFTEPKAIKKLMEFDNIDVKLYTDVKQRGYHTKAYIFEYVDSYKVIIGSSNLTTAALKSNIEWNVQVVSKKDDSFVSSVLKEFKHNWDAIDAISDELLDQYTDFIEQLRISGQVKKSFGYLSAVTIEPNSMQTRAMQTLQRQRSHGEVRSLIIAATGTGKTYLAAFDVKQFKPKKVLFVVHRENILRQAMDSFKQVLGDNINCGYFTGAAKDKEAEYLFATNLTLNNHYKTFAKNEFDYIVIDEAHHATSPSYESFLGYFTPKFLLGMTATPERTDTGNIFALFDNNVALEVRLHDAMEESLVVPFHYFGITDISSVDLSDVSIDDIAEVSKRLKVNERVDYIIQQMRLYGHDGGKLKCLAFCVSVDHALYMAEQFNYRMIPSVALTGSSTVEERATAMQRLSNENDHLKVIFTVDIFNEGVDIPSINQVLMLRPTNSPIIFIQQLGRGLRKNDDKEYLTVLDFIGNHNRTFLIAIALKGSRYFDKDSLKVTVAKEFGNIPGNTYIQMDRVSKDRILRQIEKENFRALKYLKEEYYAFKALRRGNIPFKLMDYRVMEGSPDPIKFINYKGTYIQFLSYVEKNKHIEMLNNSNTFMKAMKYLSDMLPIKRPFEFVLLRYMLRHKEIHFLQAKEEILSIISNVDDSSVAHAMECLNFEYYDNDVKKRYLQLVQRNDGVLTLTQEAKKLLMNPTFSEYLSDMIQYGLSRYQLEFGDVNYGTPFFKLYEQYSMVQTALLSNYRKTHSAFRGSGLLSNGNDYFLYVDLHKDEDIKESINYKDKLISKEIFQWESPNSTSQDSERGRNIIDNQNRGIKLHLFLRKMKTIDGYSQPYIYMGKINTIHYENNKPILIQAKFEHPVPQEIFLDLVNKIDVIQKK